MPKPAEEIAQELRGIVLTRKPWCVTFPWPKFYELCGRQRWTDAAADELSDELCELGFLIGYGEDVVLVAQDANFAPAE